MDGFTNERLILLEKKNLLKELFLPENKKARTNLFTAFAVGVLLLVMGSTFFGTPTKKEMTDTTENLKTEGIEKDTSEVQLEKRLQEIFSKIAGAGQVDVMVTTKCSVQSVVAQEEKSEETSTKEENDHGIAKVTESVKRENTVVLTEDGKGKSTPFILKENVPEIEGIVIVAEGGGDAVVQQNLTAAAQALLHVPAHKVAILKMK